jgi:hypothetical protein
MESAMRPSEAAETREILSVAEVSLCGDPVTLVPSVETGTAVM